MTGGADIGTTASSRWIGVVMRKGEPMADYEMTLHNPLTDAGLDNTNEITFLKASADVVKVVRCKDCKHFLTPHGCGHINGMVTAIDDGFCSYGERRTDG